MKMHADNLAIETDCIAAIPSMDKPIDDLFDSFIQ